jgi:hypothetical protein
VTYRDTLPQGGDPQWILGQFRDTVAYRDTEVHAMTVQRYSATGGICLGGPWVDPGTVNSCEGQSTHARVSLPIRGSVYSCTTHARVSLPMQGSIMRVSLLMYGSKYTC